MTYNKYYRFEIIYNGLSQLNSLDNFYDLFIGTNYIGITVYDL